MDTKVSAEKHCCVCGREASQNVLSPNGNYLNYCEYCASNCLENYDEMVKFGFYFNDFNKTYKEKTLVPSLNYHKKTIDQFNRDVELFLNNNNDNGNDNNIKKESDHNETVINEVDTNGINE